MNKEKPIKCNLSDGTHRVMTKYLYSGFEVKDGWIINCAPMLRNSIQFYIKIARKVDQ